MNCELTTHPSGILGPLLDLEQVLLELLLHLLDLGLDGLHGLVVRRPRLLAVLLRQEVDRGRVRGLRSDGEHLLSLRHLPTLELFDATHLHLEYPEEDRHVGGWPFWRIQYISVIVPTLGPPKNGHYKQ